jgi:Domain of unknown function (DUF1707)
MAEQDHEMAEADGRGRLRASHADRERVIDTLKAAYVYGLVTKDEFDERASQTFAARTYAELAMITADIPAGLAPAPSPLKPAPAKANTPAPARAQLRPGQRAVVATVILAVLAFVAALFASDDLGDNPVAVLLGLGATGSALLSMFLAAAQVFSSRRDMRSGGHLPPHGVINTARNTGQLPHTARPRRGKADAACRHCVRPQLSS